MPLFLVSFFAKLKIKHLLVTLGILGLVGSLVLSYRMGDSNGFSRSEVAHLESVNQSKDQAIQELLQLSEQSAKDRLEDRQANLVLSKDIRNRFNQLEKELEDAVNAPTVVNTDCRAEYDGTIGVFKSLASPNGN